MSPPLGVHDFTLYKYYILCQSWALCLHINDSRLFAFIGLTALSRIYFNVFVYILMTLVCLLLLV